MQEILISIINYDGSDIIVTPVGCPIPNDESVPKLEGTSFCIHNGDVCPYLSSVNYNNRESRKVLFCKGA